MGTQETIIYRLVMRNHDFGALQKRQNGHGRHAGAKGSRPNQKVGPPFGLTIILKKLLFENLGPQPLINEKTPVVISNLNKFSVIHDSTNKTATQDSLL